MDTIITEKIYEEQQKKDKISVFFKKFEIGKALSKSNFYKEKGTQPTELLRYLFELAFINKNIYRETTLNPQKGKSKNTIYRFLNSKVYDWCKLLYIIAMQVISIIIPLTSENRKNVLIVDDTLYSRSRSKKVDMLTRVHDHNSNKYVKGFKLLTLAWSDGNTTIPLRFRHMVSTNPKMVINAMPKNLDKRTRAYKLRKSAQMTAVEALYELIDSVDTKTLNVKYMLFDSWFSFPSVIMDTCKKGLDVICMLKCMYRVSYTYKGKKYILKDLYEAVPHNHNQNGIISSVTVTIHHSDKQEQQVKVLFLKSNHGNDWVALLSTDLSLSNEEIVRIYGKRWNIEVLFKTSKHFLHLDTELESRSFESLYAHTSIVFLRYIMLAYEARISQDPRTCGDLFFLVCDELKDISFLQALYLFLNAFLSQAKQLLVLTENQINNMIDLFIALIPRCFGLS
ncbi:MAG: transposase [Acutalibacteraceae bacterium]